MWKYGPTKLLTARQDRAFTNSIIIDRCTGAYFNAPNVHVLLGDTISQGLCRNHNLKVGLNPAKWSNWLAKNDKLANSQQTAFSFCAIKPHD